MQKRQFLATAASLTALSSTSWLAGCASRRTKTVVKPAELIYYGGPILTMNDAQPQVEAVAVNAGVIAAIGSLPELEALRANKNNTDPSRKVRFLPYGIGVSVLDAPEQSGPPQDDQTARHEPY